MPAVCFWRASDGLEVDFVIEAAGKLHGLEVKANATPLPRMADQLPAWRRLLGPQAGRCALVCDCEASHALGDEIVALPWREVGDFLGDTCGL